jgi:hypothetical protein
MAIKGKKKSQSRGSQARRRPAAAPRAIASARRGPPWYKTPQGRAAIIVFLLIVAGVVTGFVLHARSNSAKLADRQDALDRYTGAVRAVLQSTTPAASEMASAPADANDFAGLAGLLKQAKDWQDTLDAAAQEAATLRPPGSALQANALFQQSVQLYTVAAQQYEILPDQPDKLRPKLLAATTTVRDQAGQLWANAVSILDDLRNELGMRPSGLRSPAIAPPSGQPTPVPQQTEDTSGGGGGGSKKKGSKNGSK